MNFTSASRWIACPEALSAPIVRKTFHLAGASEGEICITGLGYYELFVNGMRVGDDYFKPAVSDYSHRDLSRFYYPLPGEETSHRISGKASDVTVWEIHNDISPIASFECGNETLNWLFDTYLHTQLVNMHGGVPSDCPQRERLGYTGDGQLTCESAMLTLDSRKFYEKWIADIADCQDIHTGHVQHTAPFFGGGGGPGGWGGAMVIVPYTYYRVYGDASLLEKYYSNMTAFLDCMETFCEDGLIVRERKDGWCLGDWCTPGEVKLPEPFVNTYYYLRCMEMMAEIVSVLGKTDDYSGRISICREAMVRNYFDAATDDFCGGVQGANAFVLNLGLGTERTRENLIGKYTAAPRFDTGIFGTDVLCEALAKAGETQVLFNLLSAAEYPSFGYMKENGATTLWEYWEYPEGHHSHSHPMFGGCVKQIFYGLCGLSADAGFRNITVNPKYIDGLGYLKTTLTLPSGTLSLCLTYEKGRVSVECASTGDLKVKVAR